MTRPTLLELANSATEIDDAEFWNEAQVAWKHQFDKFMEEIK